MRPVRGARSSWGHSGWCSGDAAAPRGWDRSPRRRACIRAHGAHGGVHVRSDSSEGTLTPPCHSRRQRLAVATRGKLLKRRTTRLLTRAGGRSGSSAKCSVRAREPGEDDLRLQASERRADAEMDAASEREVVFRSRIDRAPLRRAGRTQPDPGWLHPRRAARSTLLRSGLRAPRSSGWRGAGGSGRAIRAAAPLR